MTDLAPVPAAADLTSFELDIATSAQGRSRSGQCLVQRTRGGKTEGLFKLWVGEPLDPMLAAEVHLEAGDVLAFTVSGLPPDSPQPVVSEYEVLAARGGTVVWARGGEAPASRFRRAAQPAGRASGSLIVRGLLAAEADGAGVA